MAKEPAPLGPGECDTATACRLIMITAPWLGKLVKDGFVKKLGTNRYRVIDVVQGYINWLKDENRRATITKSVSRVQEARANEIELRTAREKRDLIHVDDLIPLFSDVLGTLRSELSGLPAAVTRDPELRAKVEKELDVRIAKVRASFDAASKAAETRSAIVLEPEEADA
jgi:hypothetical protein